jgi:hypothetical protein
MTAIAGAVSASIGAYRREASRLAFVPPVSTKVVTRGTGLNLGPFSLQYTATDYEFDMVGAGLGSSFADALDAAAQAQSLGDAAASAASRPDTPRNALSLRQAVTSYQTCQDRPTTVPPIMFTATA